MPLHGAVLIFLFLWMSLIFCICTIQCQLILFFTSAVVTSCKSVSLYLSLSDPYLSLFSTVLSFSSLSHTPTHILSLPMSLRPFLFLSLSHILSLPMSLRPFLFLSLSHTHSLSSYISPSFPLPLSLFLSLSHILSLPMSLLHTLGIVFLPLNLIFTEYISGGLDCVFWISVLAYPYGSAHGSHRKVSARNFYLLS